ncbi:MAG: response regulator [Kiritimatiellae bacterium]|nr:response regulator [Kiritimatiellia bacterium]
MHTEFKTAKSVYVVDDEPSIRSIIERVLQRGGYTARVFETSDEADAAVAQAQRDGEPIDLVLLDMRLGSASTIPSETLLERLACSTPPIEVVVMSGQLTSYALLDLVLRGAADFLMKPFTPQVLRDVVDKYAAVSEHRYEMRRGPWSGFQRMRRDVFVSYCPEDRQVAMGLKRLLERAEISAWCADLDLPPENAWVDENRAKAAEQCRATVLVLTRAGLASDVLAPEIKRAVARRREQGEAYGLFPVTIGLSAEDLPDGVDAGACRDFTNRARLVDHFESLAHAIRLFLHRPEG